MNQTVKITLEGSPDQVDAVAWRINQFLTVTYTSKDRSKPNSDNIIRYLRAIPPGQAAYIENILHPGPGRETTDP